MNVRKLGLLGVVFLTLSLSAQAATIIAVFANTSGNFAPSTVSGGASWAHTTAWNLSGANNSEVLLTSPTFTASGGQVTLQFDHSYNFQSGWDGGQVELSINGGAFSYVPNSAFAQNGYTSGPLNGNPVVTTAGFSGNSGGFLTSVATLATFNLGDTFAFRLHAGYDDQSELRPNPNWSLASVSLTNTELTDGFVDANSIPEPGTTALVALGVGALLAWGRRRAKK